MAERSLRGMRLGRQSMQSEEGVEYARRQRAVYLADDGTTFDVIFSDDAEIPDTWESPQDRKTGRLLDEAGDMVNPEQAAVKEARTHWDMLLERRTREELEEILEERLTYLRSRRGSENGEDGGGKKAKRKTASPAASGADATATAKKKATAKASAKSSAAKATTKPKSTGTAKGATAAKAKGKAKK